MSIETLCSWKKADTKRTLASYKLDKLFGKLGIGESAQDLFGDIPATMVHAGDISLAKPLACNAQGNGIYIIDGSLTVDGAFTFYTADAYTLLVITGDLVANDFVQAWDTQLVVLGATKIAGLLYLDLSDAGFAAFRGPVASRERKVSADVEHDVPMFAKPPKGKVVTHWSGPTEPADIHAALVRGETLTTAPVAPKGAMKTPGKAALQKMSIAEALAVPGFTKMMFQGDAVNPNWFVKGAPGCAVESVTIANAYVAAFPAELANLSELVLLGLDDETKLATMLRSVPVLRSLKRLRIADSALVELPPEVGALPSLEVLELSNNKKLTKPSGLPKKLRVSIS